MAMKSRSLGVVGAVPLMIMGSISVAHGSQYEKECALHYLEYKQELNEALADETDSEEIDRITREIAIRHYGSSFWEEKIQEDENAYWSIKNEIQKKKEERNSTSGGNKSNRPKLALELKKQVVNVDNEEKKSEILDEVNNRTINKQLSTDDIKFNKASGSEENKKKLKDEISLATSVNKLPEQGGLKEETSKKDKIETLRQEVEDKQLTFDNSVKTAQEVGTIKFQLQNAKYTSNIESALNDEKELHKKESEIKDKVVLNESKNNSQSTSMLSGAWGKITNFFKRTWGAIESLFKF